MKYLRIKNKYEFLYIIFDEIDNYEEEKELVKEWLDE